MNDFIHEINQELREERNRALWKRYGKYVIAMAVAIVVLVAGRQAMKKTPVKKPPMVFR
jgi:hypothetical protein